jgi:long-chain acyl-CoA synthetase
MAFPKKVEWLLLDASVGGALRRQLGLDCARIVVSGAAPIHPDLVRWFTGIGLPIAEGYGQTEVALVTTLNPSDAIRVGTVGPPVPGASVRIASDGEILVKGDNVCQGYWRNEAGTRELIDDDGWLHSGDLGELDDHGYLCITGRKKDLIITSSGKNITPVNIESELRDSRYITEAVVFGDNRPYLVAVVTLDRDESRKLADRLGIGTDPAAIAADPRVHAEIQREVEAVNGKLARIEQVKRFAILDHDFSQADGELTPTLKVKRGFVYEKYAEVFAGLYQGAGS